MNILAIETSCDETAAAILKDGELLSNVVVSQIDIFKTYGGVIPEIAARSHLEAILPVLDQAIEDAKLTWDDIDYVAVTHTPGLLGSLLIGTLTARTLAILHNKPLYPIHHLKSHIYSNWLKKASRRGEDVLSSGSFPPARTTTYIPDGADRSARRAVLPDAQCMTSSAESGDHDKSARPKALEADVPTFPLLALVISGGHTQIIRMTKHNDFQIIGTTLDDAVGECFDKIAKILGLPYPGGPSIATAAKTGNPNQYHFPHPKTENPLDFSFSGLKTAVLRTVQKECNVGLNYPSYDLKNLLTPEQISNFAASFQQTAIDILLEKLRLALTQHPDTKSIVFAGGVSANNALREASCSVIYPNPQTPAVRNTTITKRDRGNVVDERRTDCCISDDCAARTRTKTEREDFPQLFFPPVEFSGDNAAMVAMAAYWEIREGVQPTDPYKLTLAPRSNLC